MVKTLKRNYFDVQHCEGKITFQDPSFFGTSVDVAKQIDESGLKKPTSEETASLVYGAFQNFEKGYEFPGIFGRHLWEFTGNLYLPKKPGQEIHNGVLLETNPKFKRRGRMNAKSFIELFLLGNPYPFETPSQIRSMLKMNKESLIERLRKKDPLVRFVPFGFKVGDQTSSELEKNPYVIARYGEEGSSKIAEVASKSKHEPSLDCYESVDEQIATISSLSGDFNGLVVEGEEDFNSYIGHFTGVAFGISDSKKNKF